MLLLSSSFIISYRLITMTKSFATLTYNVGANRPHHPKLSRRLVTWTTQDDADSLPHERVESQLTSNPPSCQAEISIVRVRHAWKPRSKPYKRTTIIRHRTVELPAANMHYTGENFRNLWWTKIHRRESKQGLTSHPETHNRSFLGQFYRLQPTVLKQWKTKRRQKG